MAVGSVCVRANTLGIFLIFFACLLGNNLPYSTVGRVRLGIRFEYILFVGLWFRYAGYPSNLRCVNGYVMICVCADI